jgi:hypothetical protein|tara:strand:+ start:1022 stop:1195 length:174 start_codon:yes stop_codon:yes gene_type:complete
MEKIRLIDLIRRYRGLSHQIAAINMLQDAMPEELLDRDSDWIQCFKVDDTVNQPPFS